MRGSGGGMGVKMRGMREMAGSGAIDLQGVARRMMSFDEYFWFFVPAGAFFPQGRGRRTGRHVLIRRDEGFVCGEGDSATGSPYDDDG